jgi:hypothetical protein
MRSLPAIFIFIFPFILGIGSWRIVKEVWALILEKMPSKDGQCVLCGQASAHQCNDCSKPICTNHAIKTKVDSGYAKAKKLANGAIVRNPIMAEVYQCPRCSKAELYSRIVGSIVASVSLIIMIRIAAWYLGYI